MAGRMLGSTSVVGKGLVGRVRSSDDFVLGDFVTGTVTGCIVGLVRVAEEGLVRSVTGATQTDRKCHNKSTTVFTASYLSSKNTTSQFFVLIPAVKPPQYKHR